MAISNPFSTNSYDDLEGNSNTDSNVDNAFQSSAHTPDNSSSSGLGQPSISMKGSPTSNPMQSQHKVANTSGISNTFAQKKSILDDNTNTSSTNISTSNLSQTLPVTNTSLGQQQNSRQSLQGDNQDSTSSENSIGVNNPGEIRTVSDLNSKFLSSKGQSNTAKDKMHVSSTVGSDSSPSYSAGDYGSLTSKSYTMRNNKPEDMDTTVNLSSNNLNQGVSRLSKSKTEQSPDSISTLGSLANDSKSDILLDDTRETQSKDPSTLTDTTLPKLSEDFANVSQENLDRNIHQADNRFMAKILFLLSLILFLIVSGVFIYVYFI